MKKILQVFVLVGALLSTTWLQAQDRTVSGNITSSDDGSPIPGANVLIKGTTDGTVTDVDGNYKLTVTGDATTIVISFIGFTSQEVEIGTRSVIDVSMATDLTELSEVIVTAVGIEREAKALGYSVVKVGGDDLQQKSEPDPLRALQGKVAGVNIQGSSGAAGSATRITIRGNSSLLGNNQPLFVVDGVPYNNSVNNGTNQLVGGGAYGSRISDLDPNNIESMTVLKGAAAASLYGSRAANGVILITTKSGSGVASKKGLEVTISSSYSVEQVANLPDYQNTYGTGTNFGYQQVNGSWGAPFVGTQPYASVTNIPHWYDGVIGFEDLWGTTVPYQAYPNNVKDFFDTGSIWDNSVSISGGNEKSVVTAVVSDLRQDSYIPGSKFDRTSVSVGGKTELDNGLIINSNLTYSNAFQHTFAGGANNAIGNASAFARTLYLGRNWDLQGTPYINPLNNSNAFFVGTGQADNPLWSVENSGVESTTNRWVGSLGLGYEINEWFAVNYKFGFNGYSQSQSQWFRPGGRAAAGVGQITNTFTTFGEIESNFLVSFSKDLSESLSLRAIAGHNLNQRTVNSESVQGSNYVIFDNDNINNTNFLIPFGGGFSQRRLIGVFGDVTLGYNDYLFLNLTGRNDWSSTLPQGANSFFYPSASLSFIFTDVVNISPSILSYGKVRASFSEVGNDTAPYQLSPVYVVNANGINSASPDATSMPFNGIPGSTLSNTERDPNLRPEITQEIEVGLDLKLLNNKIGLDVSAYTRESRDQIIPISLPNSSGFTSFFTNAGVVSNKGIEVGLDVTPIELQNGFKWNIYGTFTLNRNIVESLNLEGTDELVLGNTFAGSVQGIHKVGQPYGLIKGTASARDDEGNLLIDPSNGQLISDITPRFIGDPNPDYIVGLTNTFSWKGISLNAVFDWKQGGDMYSVTNLSLLGRGVTSDTEDREVNVIIPGVYGDPNTAEPIRDENGNKTVNQTAIEVNSAYFGNSFAINGQDEWSIWDATVFRLREVSLAYTLPASLLSKTPFGSASISITGRNLWYKAPNFPEGSNFDPETSQFGNSNLQGFEFTSAPSVKRYGVNLRFTF